MVLIELKPKYRFDFNTNINILIDIHINIENIEIEIKAIFDSSDIDIFILFESIFCSVTSFIPL